MIYLKTKNFVILSFLFAIIAYFISDINEINQFSQFLPSIFIVLMAITLFFVSANSNSQNRSSTHYHQESRNLSNTDTDEKSDIESGTLYVGNLAYKADENDVQSFFESVGHVKSVRLVKDKRSGKRKGFGFVEIANGEEHKFIDKLNKAEFMQRNIIVRQANEKQH